MDETSQLKAILKNSFSSIKKDISELKDKQEEALSTGYRLKQDVEKIKDEYVAKDKFNLLKIKVGEVNDTLKKLWDLDSSLEKIEEKKTDKKEFEQRFDRLKEEIARQLSELSSSTNKKVIDYTNSVTKHIEDVNNNSAKVFSRINEQMKTVATKAQLKSLTTDLNQEFLSLKKEVAELRKIKETITASELEKRTNLINARVDLLAKEVLKTNQNVAQCVTAGQLKKLVQEVNKEFDDLKISAAEVEKLKKYMSIVESDSLSRKDFAGHLSTINSEIDSANKEIRLLVSKKDFEKQAAELNSGIDSAKKEIREIRAEARAYAKYDDVEKNTGKLEAAITRRILDLEKDITALKRFERRHEAETYAESKKAEKMKKAEIRERPAFVNSEPAVKPEPKPKKEIFYPAISAISILLIVLAFLSLGSAIIAYFALEPDWTNYLTIGAIATFIAGIVLRVIVIKKRK